MFIIITKDGEADGSTSTVDQHNDDEVGNNEPNATYFVIIIAVAVGVIILCGIVMIFIIWRWKCPPQVPPKPDDVNDLANYVREHSELELEATGKMKPQHMNGIRNDDPVTTKGTDIDDNEAEKQLQNLKIVDVWLKSVVELPQFYSFFVENGYESLDFIREIKHESELIEIGIESSSHRDKIMTAIKKLKEEYFDEGRKKLNIINITEMPWDFLLMNLKSLMM